MGIVLIFVVVFFVLFAVGNKWRRGSGFFLVARQERPGC